MYCLQDTAAAAQDTHLIAKSLGLGPCWIGAFEEEEAVKILEIPPTIRPVIIMPVGYPNENPSPRKRLPIEKIIHHEKFQPENQL